MTELKQLRKTIEDHYLTFITVAAASVIAITALVWGITLVVKKVKNDR